MAADHTMSTGDYFLSRGRPPRYPTNAGSQAAPFGGVPILLSRLRVERGYSQERLALDAGIDRAYVGRIERGTENVTISRLEALAAILQVPTAALFEESASHDQKPLALRPGSKPKAR